MEDDLTGRARCGVLGLPGVVTLSQLPGGSAYQKRCCDHLNIYWKTISRKDLARRLRHLKFSLFIVEDN